MKISKMIKEDAATKKRTSSTIEKVQRLLARKKKYSNKGNHILH